MNFLTKIVNFVFSFSLWKNKANLFTDFRCGPPREIHIFPVRVGLFRIQWPEVNMKYRRLNVRLNYFLRDISFGKCYSVDGKEKVILV